MSHCSNNHKYTGVCQRISYHSKFSQQEVPHHISPVASNTSESTAGVGRKWASLLQIGDTIPCDRPMQHRKAISIGSKTLMAPEDKTQSLSVCQVQERDENFSNEEVMVNISKCHSMILNNGTIFSEIAEGWLSKKGSGNDLVGSRGFKPRWTKLVLMSVPDNVENKDLVALKCVPVLHMYWHQYSLDPSSSIVLDNAIVIPSEKSNDHSWTAYVHRFEIRDNSGRNMWSKTCCAPKNERDQWVQALSIVMKSHEEEKAKMILLREKERRKKELPPTPKRFVKPSSIHLKLTSPRI